MIELDVIEKAEAEEPAPKQGRASHGDRFWRSANDWRGDPELEKRRQTEFMPGASDPPTASSRRDFVKLMGASMALAGLSACRRPEKHILPYARKPEEVIPGVPRYYATAMPFRGSVRGLLVESHEGRPTKVEGNPEHPLTQGTTSGFEQASVLNLYDPDRSKTVLRGGSEAQWADLLNLMGELAASGGSSRVAVLIEETSSPAVGRLREQLQETYGNLRWVSYAADGDDPAVMGMQQATGRRLRPFYNFDQADVIVSLDADFLGPTSRNFVHNTRTFADSRRLASPSDSMSRLYCVESGFSLTGGQADNRLRMPASKVSAFAQALASELGAGSGSGSRARLTGREQTFLRRLARDLQSAGEQGVVLAGETQPPAVHALCAAINSQIGAVGGAVEFLDTGREPKRPQAQEIVDLTREMQSGRLDALFIVGANPVYDLAPETGFAEAMNGVGTTVHLGLRRNETAQTADWHVPRSHYLEAWGDGRAYDGTVSIIQPLIQPLYASKSEIELLNALATGRNQDGYDVLLAQWQERLGGAGSPATGPSGRTGGFDDTWRRLLHEGYLPDSQYETAGAPVGGGRAQVPSYQEPQEGTYEVVLRLDPTLLDGRFSNNAWMQELPDPTTKITWDNVAMMSRQTARELELEVNYDTGQYYVDRVRIGVGGEDVDLPVWIQPGYPEGTIGVTMGYGRQIASARETEDSFWDFFNAYKGIYEREGPLANGVGTNVAPLRTGQGRRVITGAQVEKVGSDYMIASTQEHGSMEGRPLVRRASMDDYRENPDFAADAVHTLPGGEPWEDYPMLWEDRHPSDQPAFKDSEYYDNQWGMTIDLNTCTGCNACMVACQSENNVQVVGKDQVARGREMHWLRVDRYFVSQESAAPGQEHGAGGGNGAAGAHEADGEEQMAPANRDPSGEHPDAAFGDEQEVVDPAAMPPDDVEMVVQPVMCQHCENAPCESVCPVAATIHSPDGTNQMIYNRCIGTRYCSNNCPYKVRRFNFYNWSKSLPAEVQMAQNPNVSIRFRGVMEKCSWCIHRVREEQSRADNEERPLEDGDVLTACQQACPADAIVFGDLNDPTSRVRRMKKNSRNYAMLAELNVKPRLTYLGRVSNPNADLEEADAS